ncbi:SUMO-targeted ubiquitin ligase complex subunit SLX5 KNAG_0J01270 [Huiozyma naganishii CBS 8797]|uniref:Uncharacterized protein n=1 Tax=Huiozyma naganishii (strain ATCC MYA-139 / BCRC 22969 / CBS 8797 / KCTC 17520 / NBRC 10181 / NCYC 3082 / Yp74L-3) TaxID=1071383 RepID=J7RQV8_HUIN7|nr:hypothetical protein KNAG_0J01270 [Kazachstania naganishii CBS 8797]CCK72208.1 hypothetical protein KNAG_0J01270 [Kazachstania naganishii CBS 8797]
MVVHKMSTESPVVITDAEDDSDLEWVRCEGDLRSTSPQVAVDDDSDFAITASIERTPTDVVVVDDEPITITSTRGNDDTDEITVLEERPAPPPPNTTELYLPGRNVMHIRTAQSDNPIPTSFRNLRRDDGGSGVGEELRRSRRLRERPRWGGRMTPRATERGQRRRRSLFVNDDGEDISQNPRFMSMLMTMDPEYTSGNHPAALDEDPQRRRIRARINSYPPNIQSTFHYAQSLPEFTYIVQNTDPITFAECRDDLTNLFSQYQSMQHDDRMRNVGQQGSRQSEPRHGTNYSQRSAVSHSNNRYFYPEFNQYESDEARAQSLLPRIHDFLQMRLMGYPNDDEETTTQNIISMIQEREDTERDTRVKNFTDKSKPLLKSILKEAKSLPSNYSASFHYPSSPSKPQIPGGSTSETAESEEVSCCVLCGSELGVGIPDSFIGRSAEDRDLDFSSLISKYSFPCPYQSLIRPNQLDRDLSKRTFMSKCGHVYCGRCFARIDNAKAKSKISKKELASLKGCSNPNIYGPRICVADGCTAVIRAKARLRELYF